MTVTVDVISFDQDGAIAGSLVKVTTAPISPANPGSMKFFGGRLGTAQLSAVVCDDWDTFSSYEFLIPEGLEDGMYGFEFRFSDLQEICLYSSAGPVTVSNKSEPSGPPSISRVNPTTVTPEEFRTQKFRVYGNNLADLVSFYMMRIEGDGPARVNVRITRLDAESIFLTPNTGSVEIKNCKYKVVGVTEGGESVQARLPISIESE
ncbi:hypothetical protein [Bordetella genomosp. 5]|uniref:hypothetical protein n=1 Tax=Bordetella genomosp. 5 TaxID=1395608 RepID=UPI00113FC86B|nr:hypothetical protein [Bordetella genomosp. 5]